MKLTPTQFIRDYATKYPEGFTTADIKQASGIKGNGVNVALWHMKRSGELLHNKDGIYRLPDAQKVTGVNKVVEQDLASKYDVLYARYEHMSRALADSQAVVRYLEGRILDLTNAFDRLHGRNA